MKTDLMWNFLMFVFLAAAAASPVLQLAVTFGWIK